MSLQGTSDFISKLLQGNEEERSQLLGQTNQLICFVTLLQKLTSGQCSLSPEDVGKELEQFPGIHELLSHPQNLKQVALGFSQLTLYFHQLDDSKISNQEIHYNIDLLRICNVILCFLNSKVKIDDDMAAILKLGLIENYVRLGKTCFQLSSFDQLDPEYFEAHLAYHDASLFYAQALDVYQECESVFSDFYSKDCHSPLVNKAQEHFRKYALRFIESKMQAITGLCLIANRKRDEESQTYFKELHQTINFAIANMSFYITPEKSAKELTTQFMSSFLHLSKISAVVQNRPDNEIEIFIKSLYQIIIQHEAAFGIANCKFIEPKALSVEFLIKRIQKFGSQTENRTPQDLTILFSDDIQQAISAYHQEDPLLQLGMITMLRYWFRYTMACRTVSQTAYDSLTLESLYQIRMNLFQALEKKYSADYIETATISLENYQNACAIATSSTDDIVKWIEGPKKSKKKKTEKKVTDSTAANYHESQDNSKNAASHQTTASIERVPENDNQSQSNSKPPVQNEAEKTTIVKKESKSQISAPITSSKKTKAVTQPTKGQIQSHSRPITSPQSDGPKAAKSVSKPQPRTSTPKTTDMPTVTIKKESHPRSLPPVKLIPPLGNKDDNKQQSTARSPKAQTATSSPSKNQATETPPKVIILKNTSHVRPSMSYAGVASSSKPSTTVSADLNTKPLVAEEVSKQITILKNPARETKSASSSFITSSSVSVTKAAVASDSSDNIDKLTRTLDLLKIQQEPEPIIDSRINYFLKSIPPKVGHTMSLIKGQGKHIFIYGGYIRDTLNNKRWHDVDLISDCDEETLLRLFPSAKKNPLIKEYNVYTIAPKTSITLVKQCDLKAFSANRFLATDALFADIYGQVWDPMNVFHLLYSPILMAMPGIDLIESFKADPSRLLRTLRTATHLQRNWERKIYDAITMTSSQLKKLPFSKFLFQFSELFVRGDAVLHFYISYHLGIIPEVALTLGSDWQNNFNDQSFSFHFIKLCLAQIDHYPLKNTSHQNRLYLLALFLLPALEKNRLLQYGIGDWVYTHQAIDASTDSLLEQYFSLYEGEIDADAQRANLHQLKAILTQRLWPYFLAHRTCAIESLKAFYFQPPPNAFYTPVEVPSLYAIHDGYATYAPYYATNASPSMIPDTQPSHEPPVHGLTPK